jgi:hypothetical protein
MNFLTVINCVEEHWLINTRIEGGPQGRSGQPWGPFSLLYNVYRVFSLSKVAGAWR